MAFRSGKSFSFIKLGILILKQIIIGLNKQTHTMFIEKQATSIVIIHVLNYLADKLKYRN